MPPIAQASSSGGNSSMPALPLAWNLANRSPNVDPSPSPSHTLTLAHTLTPAEALPRLPALTYRRPLLHRIASRRAAVPGARHLTARNVSFSPWGIQLRGQHACSGASDANSRARADKAETNTAVTSAGPISPSLAPLVSFDTSPHHHHSLLFLVVTVTACAF